MGVTLTSVTTDLLPTGPERRLLPVTQTESLHVMAQHFDGQHSFRHINEKHDEVIWLIAGALKVWTEEGVFSMKPGDIITIPRNVEHGDLVGENAELLVIEGRL